MNKEEIIKELNNMIRDKDSKLWIGLNGVNAVKEVLNYIDKLQKENEELKSGLNFRVNYCKKLEQELYGEGFEETLVEKKYFVSKDKIKDKIKEIKKEYQDYIKNVPKEQQEENDIFLYKRIIEVLEELLEE